MIGVFDSGFGGLTVHRALVDTLPERDFVYLGDNWNAPYGMKTPIEVLNLTCAGLERLFREGCTLAILACNTASVVALRWIQQQWLPARCRQDGVRRNVLGIVVPTIEAATGLRWDQEPAASNTRRRSTIAIFATPRTVETDCYPIEIRKRRPDIAVVQQSCPELAGAIEQGASRKELDALVKQYVAELRQRVETPDCAILGCTHYPLVADLFAAALPSGIPLIHQPQATARALQAYLQRHPGYDAGNGGQRIFLSTGFSAEALPLIERFWGERIDFQAAC
ncbi:MAG TPA: aspartate/glutamate racemase family protein [Bryobacteraceae bacterium]|jgi:glutamate racemase|nr:aspartate/glutamate racemase family protein [Bryobacteraceae bacterium]